MAVTDFGARRFRDSEPRRARSYAYQHQAQDDDDDDLGWYEDGAHDGAEADGLGTKLGRLTHYLGAIISVVLLLGLVIWGYKLVARDVSGVPVIKAVAGDARVAPDDPGGRELSENGGLAVNEVAAGVEVPPNAEIAIAPAPTQLQDDDIAMGELADAQALQEVAQDVAPVVIDAPVVAVTDADAAANEGADLTTLTIVDIDDVDAVSPEFPVAEDQPAPVAVAARPPARPATIEARAQVAASTPAAEVTPAAAEEAVPVEEPAPESTRVASGAPLVQIGAFDSDSIAQKEWARVSGRFSSLFAGKSQLVQTTQKNGRTFYRLRVAGFGSRDDARRFCAALIAEGTDCIPATAK